MKAFSMDQRKRLSVRLILPLTVLSLVFLTLSLVLTPCLSGQSGSNWLTVFPNLALNCTSELLGIVIVAFYVDRVLEQYNQDRRRSVRSRIERRLHALCFEIVHTIVYPAIGLGSRDFPGLDQRTMLVEYEDGDTSAEIILQQFLQDVKPRMHELLLKRSPQQWSYFARDIVSLRVQVDNFIDSFYGDLTPDELEPLIPLSDYLRQAVLLYEVHSRSRPGSFNPDNKSIDSEFRNSVVLRISGKIQEALSLAERAAGAGHHEGRTGLG